MKNSEQPAFAVSKDMCEMSKITEYPFGLTKREYIAAKCLQGMMSSAYWSENFTDNDEHRKKAIDIAVKTADDLLGALGGEENFLNSFSHESSIEAQM